MPVKAKYKISDAQIADMDLSITLTMKVSEWRALMKEQNHTWPACDLKNVIDGAMRKISAATENNYAEPPIAEA